jgi:hypothetical protein
MKVIHAKFALATTKASNVKGVTVRDFNNQLWVNFNKEYYKLKLLQYKAMYELPEFVKLRQLMRAVVETNAWTQLEKDWKVITKNKYHQIVAKRQYVLF